MLLNSLPERIGIFNKQIPDDPLREAPPRKGAFLYMRPLVARMGALSVANMATIASASGDVPTYVALSHRASLRDAERLKEFLGSKGIK